MSASLPLSIVVVTHFGGALLRECVAAIARQLKGGDELLVVVSNEPGGADLEGLDEGPWEVLELGENPGFAGAANRGIERCSGVGVLLLNDDTRPCAGFLEFAREALEEPGIYQPRILLADGSGRLDNTGHGLFPDGFNWALGREDMDGEAYDEAGEVGAVSGAAMIVHREVFDAVGLFDEAFNAFGEDVDLSLRARRRGYPLRYLPEARIEHHLGASYGRYGARKVFLIERNRVRAAVRSMPMSLVATMPLWTVLRLSGLAVAGAAGRGWSGRVPKRAQLAALAGVIAGARHLPDAFQKRSADAAGWVEGERSMLEMILNHRVRVRDLLR